jgi:hypothetical protein
MCAVKKSMNLSDARSPVAGSMMASAALLAGVPSGSLLISTVNLLIRAA